MRNKEEVVTEEAEIERSKKKGGGDWLGVFTITLPFALRREMFGRVSCVNDMIQWKKTKVVNTEKNCLIRYYTHAKTNQTAAKPTQTERAHHSDVNMKKCEFFIDTPGYLTRNYT